MARLCDVAYLVQATLVEGVPILASVQPQTTIELNAMSPGVTDGSGTYNVIACTVVSGSKKVLCRALTGEVNQCSTTLLKRDAQYVFKGLVAAFIR